MVNRVKLGFYRGAAVEQLCLLAREQLGRIVVVAAVVVDLDRVSRMAGH